MEKIKTTPKKSQAKKVEFSWKFMGNLFEKAGSNELLRKALKKLANTNDNGLRKFLGQVQILFGRLKRVVSDISLESTGHFKTSDFFKTKSEGGIFASVDGDIFKWFDTEVKNSPAKELSSYEYTEDITEENIIGDATAGGIYEEVDFAHIKQVCYRHIVNGEQLLSEMGSNHFWVRNKKGELCKVSVWLFDGGWDVFVIEFDASYEWDAGRRSFFRN
jgi:hypothetical protein